jgi:hypothetical protein
VVTGPEDWCWATNIKAFNALWVKFENMLDSFVQNLFVSSSLSPNIGLRSDNSI